MAAGVFAANSGAGIPNSSLPLIVAPGAVPAPSAREVHALLTRNGWQGAWTYTIYDFWHFHVTGYEVLVCIAGTARIGFGGPLGAAILMTPGDVVIVLAGVGHRRLSATEDFAVVGAYPPGQDGTVTRAGQTDLAAAEAVGRLPVPRIDPLSGERPGRLAVWLPDAALLDRPSSAS